jgi:hypothetical protein
VRCYVTEHTAVDNLNSYMSYHFDIYIYITKCVFLLFSINTNSGRQSKIKHVRVGLQL